MIRLILILLALLIPSLSWATVTVGGISYTQNGSTTTGTCTIASDVDAGATVFALLTNRTDYTVSLNSVSDPVNGAWTASSAHQQADSASGGGALYYFPNSQALTGANLVVTFTTGSAVNQVITCGWAKSDLGALTYDTKATDKGISPTTTAWTSNQISTGSGNGVIICAMVMSDSQSAQPTMNAGETIQTAAAANFAYLATITFTGTTNHTCDATMGATARGDFYAMSLLEPAASAVKSLMLMGIGK